MANACKSYTTIVSIAKSSPIMFSGDRARPDPEIIAIVAVLQEGY